MRVVRSFLLSSCFVAVAAAGGCAFDASGVNASGKSYIVGEPGQRYTIVVRNRTNNRFECVISVDGLELKDFDYIDIGTMLPSSGAVPVVIKSLIFPTTTGVGQEWQAAPRAVGEVAAG